MSARAGATLTPAGVVRRLRVAVLGSAVTEVRTVVWTGGALLVGQFLLALHGILTARVLGPAGKGVLTGLTTWAQVLGWAALAGLGTASGVRLARVPRGSDEQGEELRAVLGNALVFSVVGGGSVALVAMLIVPRTLAHLGTGARSLSILALAVIPVAVIANIIWSIQLSLGRSHLFNLAQIVNPAVMLVVTTGFIATVGLTPGRAVVSTMCGAVMSFAVAVKDLPWRSIRVSIDRLLPDLRFGLKVHLGDVFQLANYRLDYLVMSALLPAVQLGLYGTANTFMLPLATIPAAVSVLLTPKVARLASRELPASVLAEEQRVLITAEATRYTLLAVIGGVTIAILGPFVLPFLLGGAFRPSVHLMWILIPGYVLFCFSTVVAAGAAGMGRAWVPTVIQGAAIIVTLVLLPILLPIMKGTGAAVTSSIAYGVSAAAAALVLVWLKRRAPRPPDVDVAPARAAGADPRFPGALSS